MGCCCLIQRVAHTHVWPRSYSREPRERQPAEELRGNHLASVSPMFTSRTVGGLRWLQGVWQLAALTQLPSSRAKEALTLLFCTFTHKARLFFLLQISILPWFSGMSAKQTNEPEYKCWASILLTPTHDRCTHKLCEYHTPTVAVAASLSLTRFAPIIFGLARLTSVEKKKKSDTIWSGKCFR